jgi:hypothetical protein
MRVNAAADAIARFEHDDGAARRTEIRSRRKASRARANYGDIPNLSR